MNNFPKAPCVGENLVWYPHGDTNQSPFAATVVQRFSDQSVTICTLSPTGKRDVWLNVKHVNHPDHETAPEGVRRWGAWDLIGQYEEKISIEEHDREVKRELARVEAEKSMSIDTDVISDPDEDEMRIIKFSREMGDIPGRAQLVADKIGAEMTHQRVNAVLRKFPHLLNGELPEELLGAGK